MVENWELKSVERRIDTLEKSIERDRERAAKEKEETREEERRRAKRRSDRIDSIMWTLYVIALTTIVVLAVTDKVHRH